MSAVNTVTNRIVVQGQDDGASEMFRNVGKAGSEAAKQLRLDAGQTGDAWETAASRISGAVSKITGSLSSLRDIKVFTALGADATQGASTVSTAATSIGSSVSRILRSVGGLETAGGSFDTLGDDAVDGASYVSSAADRIESSSTRIKDALRGLAGSGTELRGIGEDGKLAGTGLTAAGKGADRAVSGFVALGHVNLTGISTQLGDIGGNGDTAAQGLDAQAGAADRAAKANTRLADSNKRLRDNPAPAGGTYAAAASGGTGPAQSRIGSTVAKDVRSTYTTTQRTATTVGGGVALGVAGSIYEGAHQQSTLYAAAANANMTPADRAWMQQLVRQYMKTPAQYGDLDNALFHITSIFGTQNKPLDRSILDSATKSAISTGGNPSDVADVLARFIHNFYGTKVKPQQVPRIMDQLHYLAGSGDVDLQQFVDNTQKSSGFAASFGVNVPDFGSLYAVLSKQLGASPTDTQMANLFTHIAMPSAGTERYIQALSKQSGVDLTGDFSAKGLKNRGIFNILEDIQRATGGDPDKLKHLIPAQRGALGLMDLERALPEAQALRQRVATQAPGITERQYDAMMTTAGAKMDMVGNKARILGADLSKDLMPAFDRFINQASGWADKLDHAVKTNPGAVNGVAQAGLAAGAIGLALRAAKFVVEPIWDTSKLLFDLGKWAGTKTGGMTAAGTAARAAAGLGEGASVAEGGAGAAAGVGLGTAGLLAVLAAIGAVGAVGVGSAFDPRLHRLMRSTGAGSWLDDKNNDLTTYTRQQTGVVGNWIGDTLGKIGNFGGQLASAMGTAIQKGLAAAEAGMGQIGNLIGRKAGEWGNAIGSALGSLGSTIGGIFSGLGGQVHSWIAPIADGIEHEASQWGSAIRTWLAPFGSAFGNFFSGLGGALHTTLAGIGSALQTTVSGWGGAIKTALAPVGQAFQSIGTWAASVAGTIGSKLATATSAVASWVGGILGKLGNLKDQGLSLIGSWASGIVSHVASWTGSTLGTIGSWSGNVLGKIGNFKDAALSTIGSWVSSSLSAFGNWATSSVRTVGGWASSVLSKIESGLGSALGAIGSWIGTSLGKLGTWAGSFAASAGTATGDFLGELGPGLGQALAKIGGFIGDSLGKLGTWAGDMAGKAGTAMGNLASGIASKAGKISSALVGAVKGAVSGALDYIKQHNPFDWLKDHMPSFSLPFGNSDSSSKKGSGGTAASSYAQYGNRVGPGLFGMPGSSTSPGPMQYSGLPNGYHTDIQEPPGTPFYLPKGQYQFEREGRVYPGEGDYEYWSTPNGGQIDFMHMRSMPVFVPGQSYPGGTYAGLSGGVPGVDATSTTGAHLHVGYDPAAYAYLYKQTGGRGFVPGAPVGGYPPGYSPFGGGGASLAGGFGANAYDPRFTADGSSYDLVNQLALSSPKHRDYTSFSQAYSAWQSMGSNRIPQLLSQLNGLPSFITKPLRTELAGDATQWQNIMTTFNQNVSKEDATHRRNVNTIDTSYQHSVNTILTRRNIQTQTGAAREAARLAEEMGKQHGAYDTTTYVAGKPGHYVPGKAGYYSYEPTHRVYHAGTPAKTEDVDGIKVQVPGKPGYYSTVQGHEVYHAPTQGHYTQGTQGHEVTTHHKAVDESAAIAKLKKDYGLSDSEAKSLLGLSLSNASWKKDSALAKEDTRHNKALAGFETGAETSINTLNAALKSWASKAKDALDPSKIWSGFQQHFQDKLARATDGLSLEIFKGVLPKITSGLSFGKGLSTESVQAQLNKLAQGAVGPAEKLARMNLAAGMANETIGRLTGNVDQLNSGLQAESAYYSGEAMKDLLNGHKAQQQWISGMVRAADEQEKVTVLQSGLSATVDLARGKLSQFASDLQPIGDFLTSQFFRALQAGQGVQQRFVDGLAKIADVQDLAKQAQDALNLKVAAARDDLAGMSSAIQSLTSSSLRSWLDAFSKGQGILNSYSSDLQHEAEVTRNLADAQNQQDVIVGKLTGNFSQFSQGLSNIFSSTIDGLKAFGAGLLDGKSSLSDLTTKALSAAKGLADFPSMLSSIGQVVDQLRSNAQTDYATTGALTPADIAAIGQASTDQQAAMWTDVGGKLAADRSMGGAGLDDALTQIGAAIALQSNRVRDAAVTYGFGSPQYQQEETTLENLTADQTKLQNAVKLTSGGLDDMRKRVADDATAYQTAARTYGVSSTEAADAAKTWQQDTKDYNDAVVSGQQGLDEFKNGTLLASSLAQQFGERMGDTADHAAQLSTSLGLATSGSDQLSNSILSTVIPAMSQLASSLTGLVTSVQGAAAGILAAATNWANNMNAGPASAGLGGLSGQIGGSGWGSLAGSGGSALSGPTTNAHIGGTGQIGPDGAYYPTNPVAVTNGGTSPVSSGGLVIIGIRQNSNGTTSYQYGVPGTAVASGFMPTSAAGTGSVTATTSGGTSPVPSGGLVVTGSRTNPDGTTTYTYGPAGSTSQGFGSASGLLPTPNVPTVSIGAGGVNVASGGTSLGDGATNITGGTNYFGTSPVSQAIASTMPALPGAQQAASVGMNSGPMSVPQPFPGGGEISPADMERFGLTQDAIAALVQKIAGSAGGSGFFGLSSSALGQIASQIPGLGGGGGTALNGIQYQQLVDEINRRRKLAGLPTSESPTAPVQSGNLGGSTMAYLYQRGGESSVVAEEVAEIKAQQQNLVQWYKTFGGGGKYAYLDPQYKKDAAFLANPSSSLYTSLFQSGAATAQATLDSIDGKLGQIADSTASSDAKLQQQIDELKRAVQILQAQKQMAEDEKATVEQLIAGGNTSFLGGLGFGPIRAATR